MFQRAGRRIFIQREPLGVKPSSPGPLKIEGKSFFSVSVEKIYFSAILKGQATNFGPVGASWGQNFVHQAIEIN